VTIIELCYTYLSYSNIMIYCYKANVSEFVITVILLLANGDPEDSLSSIRQAIDAGNRLLNTSVTILSFGFNTSRFSVYKVYKMLL